MKFSTLLLLKITSMKTSIKSMFLFALALIAMDASAQATLNGFSYNQNFDEIASGLPAGWSVRLGATSSSNGTVQAFNTDAVSWGTTTAGFRNVAAAETPLAGDATSAAQEQSIDRALGLRQTAAFGDVAADLPIFSFQIANTMGISDFNLNFKLMQCHQLAAPQRTVTWVVEYALGNTPNSWIGVATNPATLTTTQGIWGSTIVTVDFGNTLDNQTENVWIRIRAAGASTGTNSRPHTAIDDFVLSYNNANICSAPTTQASNILFEDVTDNSLSVSWTNGNGAGRVVMMNSSNNFTAPANFSNPDASTVYTGGQQVIYNGSTSGPVTVSGLNHSTVYWFRVYEFCGPDRIYQTAEANGNASQIETEVCVTAPGVANITGCSAITWIDGNTYSESNNTATFTLTTNNGCDSLVTLNFTLISFEAEMTLDGSTLTAFPTGASYQWVNCNNNNAPISGANGMTFTPTVTGNYAVVVTLSNCPQQSECQEVTIEDSSSLEDFLSNALSISPNPAEQFVSISGLSAGASIQVLDLQGNLVLIQIAQEETSIIETAKFASGVYFIHVSNANQNTQIQKLMVK